MKFYGHFVEIAYKIKLYMLNKAYHSSALPWLSIFKSLHIQSSYMKVISVYIMVFKKSLISNLLHVLPYAVHIFVAVAPVLSN